ncbi:hypothetical protein STEG23_025417 [Scotinomys teguina]
MAASAALILPESPSYFRHGGEPAVCVPDRNTRNRLAKAESSFSEEEEEKLQAAFSLEKQELHLVLETISFVLEQLDGFQFCALEPSVGVILFPGHHSYCPSANVKYQAVYHNVKPAALQQQLENIHLTQDKAEAFANAWSAMGQETIEKFRQRILGPHKGKSHVPSFEYTTGLFC